MRIARPDALADLAAAFLIGAGLGVAAAVLLRPERPTPKRRRILRRLANRRSMVRHVRAVLASIGER